MADEIQRRLVHASTTLVPLGYLLFEEVDWRVLQGFLAVCLVGSLVLEIVRLQVGLDWRLFDRLTRGYEKNNLAGYFLGIVGMCVVVFAYPPESEPAFVALAEPSSVAVPALLMLTIADPVSGLLGSGELRTSKQLWVLLVTFAVATLLAVPFVSSPVAIIGGLVATVADGVKPVVRGYVIDDNLTIPIAAATAMYLAVEFLPAISV